MTHNTCMKEKAGEEATLLYKKKPSRSKSSHQQRNRRTHDTIVQKENNVR